MKFFKVLISIVLVIATCVTMMMPASAGRVTYYQGRGQDSSFFLHVAFQLIKHHLLKRSPFPQCITSASSM